MDELTPKPALNPLFSTAMDSGVIGVMVFILVTLFVILLYFLFFHESFRPKFKIFGLVLSFLTLTLVSSQIGTQVYHNLLAAQETRIINSQIIPLGNNLKITFSTNKSSYGYLKYRLKGQTNYQFLFPPTADSKTFLHSFTLENANLSNLELYLMVDGKAFLPDKN